MEEKQESATIKNQETFTTTPESPICEDGASSRTFRKVRDEWLENLAKRATGKATPVKVWWFTSF